MVASTGIRALPRLRSTVVSKIVKWFAHSEQGLILCANRRLHLGYAEIFFMVFPSWFRQLFWLIALLLALTSLWWAMTHSTLPDDQVVPVTQASKTITVTAHALQQAEAYSISYHGLTAQLANPLERASDLRAIYEQYRQSSNPIERAISARAWSACFPTFIAAKGKALSLEQVTRGLRADAPETSARIEAYRRLLGRCQSFSDMAREDLVRATQIAQEHTHAGRIASPGQIAEKYWRNGQHGDALRVVREVLDSQDAYAVGSLKDFAYAYWRDWEETHINVATAPIRPDLRAQAYLFAACEMGLVCDAASLSADLMCAHEAKCESNLQSRMLMALSENDQNLLRQETRRVLDAVKLKRTEGLGFES